MRLSSVEVAPIATVVEDDLSRRDTKLQEPHIKGLVDLAPAVLLCRTPILLKDVCIAEADSRKVKRKTYQ